MINYTKYQNVELVPVMEDIVDSMRVELEYSTSTFDGTYTTINIENNFKAYETVVINDTDYLIYEAGPTFIKVKGDVTMYNEIKSKGPYFLYGHMLEIANVLTERDKSNNLKFQKYPCIILPMDIESEYDSKGIGMKYRNIKLYIVQYTLPEYRAEDRLEKTFRPVLYPLYEKLIYNIRYNKQVNTGDGIFPPHKKIDRLFWGTSLNSKNTSTILGDYLDAIEVSGLNLTVTETKC